MPPAKAMSSQPELSQWGPTSMDDWHKQGYSTTYSSYGTNYSLDRRALHIKPEETPWSTTNATYGKGLLRERSGRSGSDAGSVHSYRSLPSYRAPPLDLNADSRPSARSALEERLARSRRRSPERGQAGAEPPEAPTRVSLPPLDPSKYLVAQGPPAGLSLLQGGFNQDRSASSSNVSSTVPPPSSEGPALTGSSESVPAPPKTGPARRFMRDQLDRFLKSIPEELRPKTTRRQIQPRQGPQILKIRHGSHKKSSDLEDPLATNGTALSHDVPSSASSSSSCSSRGNSSSGASSRAEGAKGM